MRYQEDSEAQGVFIAPGAHTPAQCSFGNSVTTLCVTHRPPQPCTRSGVLRCPGDTAAPPARCSWPAAGLHEQQGRSRHARAGQALCTYKPPTPFGALAPQSGSWQPALGSSRDRDFSAKNQAATPMGKPIARVPSGCTSACACTTGLLPAYGSILVSVSDHWKIHSFEVLETTFTLPGIPI